MVSLRITERMACEECRPEMSKERRLHEIDCTRDFCGICQNPGGLGWCKHEKAEADKKYNERVRSIKKMSNTRLVEEIQSKMGSSLFQGRYEKELLREVRRRMKRSV